MYLLVMIGFTLRGATMLLVLAWCLSDDVVPLTPDLPAMVPQMLIAMLLVLRVIL